MKDLKKAYLRVSVQTAEQFETAVGDPAVDLIYLDAGLFSPDAWKDLVTKCHKGTGGFGKLAGIRLPQIWRKKTELFFESHFHALSEAGFDAFLAGNPEEILWLKEKNIPEEKWIADASVYSFNSRTEETWNEITGCVPAEVTWSAELNFREMLTLMKNSADRRRELTVYGRTPLMVTAQCLRKTSIGCDRRISLMWMKDRISALMPVRNCCTFCTNTIYNSVPTVLFDLKEELSELAPDSVRYEFTCENTGEVKRVLSGFCPEGFTRGHFKRGVL